MIRTVAPSPAADIPVPVPPAPVPPPITDPPPDARIYVSTQDDWWDLIAIRVYGAQRGNEHLMYRLLEANYHLVNVARFPAGLAVVVPDIPVKTTIPLVPWKSAVII
jgi:phage tail protein X